ncbi:hypothetical protein YYG_04065 [Plasmodium vinckei petteri]|uniref:PIR protein CIR protein n=2 Tax=Plasmodium vinckei petteri TaxID=138298 RepID=W7ABC7_PLAVN|nr:hypothetical protein YYG_04065 [Plasmodium vinckei petteri]
MGHKQMCEKFLSYDKIINGEHDSNITMEEIIKDPEFNKYCPNSKCETDMQSIGAMSAYLFNQLRTQIKEEYYEYFMMWLSGKLFNIVNDKKITLNSAYDKYLKNNIVNINYWDLLDNIKGLKEANLKHMSEFYKLLNHICKAIVYYKPNDADIKNLIIISSNCSNQYLSLYNSVPKCNSYHYLLDNLKDIYDKFRNPALKEIKKKYPHLASYLQTLTTPDGIEMTLSIGFKTFDFSNQKCKPKIKKKSTTSKETNPPSISPSPQSLPVSSSQSNTKLQEPQESGKINQNGQDNSKSEQNALDSKNLNADSGVNDPRTPSGGTGDPASGVSGTSSTPGEFFDLWSPFRGFLLNGMEIYNKASKFVKENHKKFNDVKDQISDAYNNAVDNLKSAYSVSSSYFSEIISNVIGQLNQTDTSSKSSDKHPVSSGSMDRGNAPNPLKLTQPSTPLSSQPPTSTLFSKSLDQQSTSDSGKGLSQTVASTKGTLSDPSSNPNTKNENITTVANIKTKETSSIWCIGPNKNCDITGIGIIVISISITLAIMYKYLSFEWRKELKKKEKMKRIINLFGVKKRQRQL